MTTKKIKARLSLNQHEHLGGILFSCSAHEQITGKRDGGGCRWVSRVNAMLDSVAQAEYTAAELPIRALNAIYYRGGIPAITRTPKVALAALLEALEAIPDIETGYSPRYSQIMRYIRRKLNLAQ